MAPPPSYGDLDKNIRDLFNRGYNYNFWKFDCRSKTTNGIELSTSGFKNNETGKVFGFVEGKQKFWDNKATGSTKWTTDQTFFSDFTVQDIMAEGLRLGLGSIYVPSKNTIKNKFKMAYGRDYFKMDADFNIDYYPLINFAAVLGYENIFLGYQSAFDTDSISLAPNNFALAYIEKTLALHVALNNVEQFFCSIFHKVSNSVDVGAQLSWMSESGETKVGLGAKWQMDKDASVRAKLNNAFQLGLGYQQKLCDGITLFLSSLFNLKDINSTDHRIGASLELEV